MNIDNAPIKDELYVEVEAAEDLELILKSGKFFPTLATGPTGAGKTKAIEQLCARLGRQLIRVNVTSETDEDSFMGGFRLVNGETVFHKGPVIKAMEEGAVLLLDEIDLGHPQKLMCLQSVLEGAGYLIKRTGEYVKPSKGFGIVATSNTKGLGDDEKGIYVGTQVLNGAMLDRFPLVVEFDYATEEEENKILMTLSDSIGADLDEDEAETLVKWARHSRNPEGEHTLNMEFSISTRHLCNIVRAKPIFGSIDDAVIRCLRKFDKPHQQAFKEWYDLIKDNKEPVETVKENVIKFS